MSQNVKAAWSGSSTFTFSGLSTLANNTFLASTAVDNSANLYLDAVYNFKLTTNTSGTSSTGYVEVYLSESADNTTYPDNANLRLLDVMSTTANNTVYDKSVRVGAAVGGILPDFYKIVVNNVSGAALSAATVLVNSAYLTIG